jgi:DNA-binding PadR family transcriptional regulator
MADPKLIAKILRSKLKYQILVEISKEKITQAQLSKRLNLYRSHINQIITDLAKDDFIICLNPKDRDYKFYEITKLGKDVLLSVDKIKKEL